MTVVNKCRGSWDPAAWDKGVEGCSSFVAIVFGFMNPGAGESDCEGGNEEYAKLRRTELPISSL